ncbi:hypothetical protein [Xanthomonas fragariae]|uniref:hypothetical protein n=1 Tax=Xanthomonas fragariae TaxID=48664 RepID=UPI003530BD9E
MTSSLAAIFGWPDALADPTHDDVAQDAAQREPREQIRILFLFCFLVIAFVVGQRIPLFATEIVEASRSRVGIAVLAVASQRMRRHLQCAQHCLHGDDRFVWKLTESGKQSFAKQLARMWSVPRR